MPQTDVTSAASALHASPSAYALMLGSGTSRSSGIPTGWEIAIDLIRRLAAAAGDKNIADPKAWYLEHHDEDPDYSLLLEYLAPSSGDRQAVLAPYFNPTDDEVADGRKAPTAAHRAIAELVRAGVVKVIITTNFDRLLERALQAVGIEPMVISTNDGATAVAPLHSVRCLVVKVHGDQASPDLRNTLAELEVYDEGMERLLARILDEHGLIVCGWSASWDPALRKLMTEHQSPYYTTFWAAHGEPTPEAQEVLKARMSVPLTIEGADELFDELAGKVAAINDIRQAGPTGPDVAVAELKRYLDDPTARVRLRDLFRTTTQAALDATDHTRLPVGGAAVSIDSYDAHLTAIEAAMATTVELLVNLGYYASDGHHDDLAVSVIRHLATRPVQLTGTTLLINAQRYPALLGLYSLGLGAMANRRPVPLARSLAEITASDRQQEDEALGYYLAAPHVLSDDTLRKSAEFERRKTAASDRIHDRLRPHVEGLIPNSDDYDGFFDDVEYLIGLAAMDFSERWGPIGRFSWRREYASRGARDEIVQRYADDLLTAGLFRRSPDRLAEIKAPYDEFVSRNARW